MKNSVLIFAVFISFSVFAKKKPKLENFKEGVAILVKGAEDFCEDEIDVYYTEGNEVVSFGPYHLFSTEPKVLKLPGDAPGDENCLYEADNVKSVAGPRTTLKYSEVRTCDNAEMHRLTKTVVLEKKDVILTVQQTGKDAQSYECHWRLK